MDQSGHVHFPAALIFLICPRTGPIHNKLGSRACTQEEGWVLRGGHQFNINSLGRGMSLHDYAW